MVTKYGMSDELGPIAFGTGHDEVFLGRDYSSVRNYSETVAAKIDSIVGEIITNAYNRCTVILQSHSDKLAEVANYLMKNEKIGEKDFADLMAGNFSPSDADNAVEASAQPDGEQQEQE